MATNPTDAITASQSALSSSGLLQFPSTIGNFYSRFSFVSYSRSNPKIASTVIKSTDIILPLPFNLKEQYAMVYSGTNLDFVEAGVSVVQDIFTRNGSISEGMDAPDRRAATDAVQAFARSSSPFDKLSSEFDRATGTIVNPHMVNIFKGVDLRTHHFSWQFSPTSQAEAASLLKIVQTFRERMHPTKKTNNEFILNFPDEMYVTMYGSAWMYPVFKSVVQELTIDYTDGRPNAWFIDGTPVTITVNLTLQEVETLTREDFTQQQATTTGTQTTGVGHVV